jgi:hypothetical protein
MCLLTGTMRSHVASTAILVVFLFASTLQANSEPIDGITGLQVLPTTSKGQLFGACFNAMLQSYGISDQILYDVRVNRTVAPIEVSMDGQFAEQVGLQYAVLAAAKESSPVHTQLQLHMQHMLHKQQG